MRQKDWSQTPLGPIQSWPQSLRTTVSLCLASNFPINIIWGADNTQIYNDGYRVLCGEAHPDALGQAYDKTWASAWPAIGEPFGRARAGETSYLENQRMFLMRNGYPEETFFTFSLSPIRDESGGIGGVFHPMTETTAIMLAERRMRALRDFTAQVGTAADEKALAAVAMETLSAFPFDLPFLLWYECAPDGTEYRLAGHHGLRPGSPVSPSRLSFDADEPWPARNASQAVHPVEVNGLVRLIGETRCGPYDEAPDRALVLPVRISGAGTSPVLLIVGVSPRLPFDDVYRGFYEMLAAAVSAALFSVRAREARLTLSEESLRLSTDAAGVGTWDLDIPRDALTWPARTKAMFGISSDAPCGMADFYAGLHPEDRAATSAAFAAAIDPLIRGTYDVEYRTIGKEDGLTRWVAAKGKGLFDAHGHCVRAIGTAIDITARKRLEVRRAALIEFADRIRDLADPAALAYAAAEILANTLGVSRAGYGTIDTAAETITIERDWNAPGIKSLAGVLHFRDYGSYIDDLKAGRTVAISDAHADPRTATTADALAAISARSFVNMPVTENGGFVALLYLNHQENRDWPDDELEFVREIAGRTRTATARLTAEQELRASQGQLEAIANSIDQMIWSAEAQGSYDYFNQRWYDYTGLPRGATDGDNWNRLLHPDDRGHALDLWQQCLRSGEPFRAEYRLRHRSGQHRWVLARAQPVRDAGRITRWYGTCTDIEDMVAAREVLARSREDLEALVQARTAERNQLWNLTSLLVAVAGFDSLIREVNPAWPALLGWSEAELIGRSYADFIHPDDVAGSLGWAARLAAGQEVADQENRYRRKDGAYRWIAWSITAGDGVFHCIGRDITEQREQAAALSAAEDALRQSQKMEAVGQLTGGLAHDFNNLLAGISGSLERIGLRMAQGRPSEIERYVSAAQGAARRAASLTHRLLAFSRRQTLDPKSTDVNRLISGMEDLIRRTVGPAIAIDVVGASSLWSALVDPPQLESALLNLCINARDAMPSGGRVTIETANRWLDRPTARRHDMPEGQYLSVCVTDTGTGMPPDVIAKAFDPFFTTKPIGEGTGLGLSMVYGFAKQSGGEARIYSEVGRGTTVCIYLPRHDGEGEAEGTSDAPGLSVEAEHGETVLVVDDEPTVRMLVTDVLEDLGYIAIEAADSATGLKILQSSVRVDLLVSDVGLPGGMNGRQMADAARGSRPGLKVLFMTGYAENAAVGNGFLAPGMAVLTKPFALDALAARIKEMIAAR